MLFAAKNGVRVLVGTKGVQKGVKDSKNLVGKELGEKVETGVGKQVGGKVGQGVEKGVVKQGKAASGVGNKLDASGSSVQKTRLPELSSGKVTEGQLMDAAEKWLGKEYKDMGNGRYLSKDGLRQFRYGKHETKNLANHHAHFETYNKPHSEGGVLVEKAVVDVIK